MRDVRSKDRHGAAPGGFAMTLRKGGMLAQGWGGFNDAAHEGGMSEAKKKRRR